LRRNETDSNCNSVCESHLVSSICAYVGIKAPSAHQVFAKELTFTEAKVTTWVEFLEISELAGMGLKDYALKRSDAVAFVYKVEDLNAFKEFAQFYEDVQLANDGQFKPCVMIGLQDMPDYPHQTRVISESLAQKFAKQKQVLHTECSLENVSIVDSTFKMLTAQVLQEVIKKDAMDGYASQNKKKMNKGLELVRLVTKLALSA